MKNKEAEGWVLVTGGAKRLGKEIAKQLAHEGKRVVIQYNKSEEEATACVRELSARGAIIEMIQGSFDTEVALFDFIARYIGKFPQTKYLINNVGNYLLEPLLTTSYSSLHSLFQTNLFAPLMLITGSRRVTAASTKPAALTAAVRQRIAL